MMKGLKIGFVFLLSIFSVAGFSQSVSAVLSSDSSRIQIGDYLSVKLQVKHSKDAKLQFPLLRDSLGSMEIISLQKPDTISTEKEIAISQNVIVSAYDSGDFYAGPVRLFFSFNGTTDTLFSNVLPIRVNTLDVDTAKPFKPIKAPLKVPYDWKEFIYYIIAAIVLLGFGIAFFIMYRQQENKKQIVYTRPMPKDPAHIWAFKELKKIEEEKLWQNGEIKLYYSRITDTLRLYLEYRYRWFALEETTEEIEMKISTYIKKDKPKENLLQLLRTADLAKFAKVTPLPNDNISAMENAVKFIEWTKPQDETKNDKTKDEK